MIADIDSTEPDNLLSLGFYRDECSATRFLYMAQTQVDQLVTRRRNGRNGRSERSAIMLIAIVVIVIGAISGLYCCIKNRGKLCKGNKGAANQESSQNAAAHSDSHPRGDSQVEVVSDLD